MNQTNPLHILRFPKNKISTKLEDGVYLAGKYGTDSYDIFLLEDTEVENGFFIKPVILQGKFKWGQEYLDNAIKNGVHIYIQTKAFSPSYEKDEYEPEKPWNIINNTFGVGTNENASTELKELMGSDVFSYPKPVSLIKYLTNFIVNKNDLVVDFFSGSATTANAVMQLNAEDKGNRKFIMVQFPEDLDKNIQKATDQKARIILQNAINLTDSIKKPHLLTEIGKERIRRAGEKIKAEHATTAPNLDIGFRVLKVAESNMKDVYYSPAQTSQDLLDSLESNIKDDRTDLDLLFACLIDFGVELSLPLKSEIINGVSVHTVQSGEVPDIIACFAENIPESVVREIASRQPLRAVFRDSSFKDSPSKINVKEIFKYHSPNTTIKVL